MMSISDVFAECRARRQTALIPYLTVGFPTEKMFLSLISSFVKSGADIIEIGIPFSDPLADGPTIQYSSQRALVNGITVDRTLQLLTQVDKRRSKPFVIMSYLNPLLQYGLERFARKARHVGVCGLIIPDLIVDESAGIEKICRRESIDMIHLLAPTTTPDRQKLILSRSRGFVYLVSVAGVTGAREKLPKELNRWITDVKRKSQLPVAVGFGISGPEQARQVARVADGVIVGSAIIDVIRNGSSTRKTIMAAQGFLGELKKALTK